MRFVIGSEKMQAIAKHRALRCFLLQGREDLPGCARYLGPEAILPSEGDLEEVNSVLRNLR
jgi:hypothetical protein